MILSDKIKALAKATELLADRVDRVMQDTERLAESATTLPMGFDDLLFAHDKIREAQYALESSGGKSVAERGS